MSTNDPDEPRRKRIHQQSKEKFETLGRFVQSFELMVQAARAGIGFMSGISGKRGLLLNIILNHQVMSAKPLMDVFRAIANTIIDDADTQIPNEEKLVLRKVITQVANRYQEICTRRNDLLHGTWYIGWHSQEDEDLSDFTVSKFKVAAKGLVSADNPKNVSDLQAIQHECEHIEDILFVFPSSIAMAGDTTYKLMWPSQTLDFVDGSWTSKRKMTR